MIETSFIIALTVYFLHVTTLEGQIFHGIRRLTFNWPGWLKKPVFDCPICMSPYYGSIILLCKLLPCNSFSDGALMIATAAGINAVLVYFKPVDCCFEDEDTKNENT
jgi:hypothetical protein